MSKGKIFVNVLGVICKSVFNSSCYLSSALSKSIEWFVPFFKCALPKYFHNSRLFIKLHNTLGCFYFLMYAQIRCFVWVQCNIMNSSFFFAPSLPEYVVVPVSLADQDLKQYSLFFTDQRIPVSSFSDIAVKKVWFIFWRHHSFFVSTHPSWHLYTMCNYLYALPCRSGAGVIKMEVLLFAWPP